jgi:uncharacterized protein YpiB (UPF0302 family)
MKKYPSILNEIEAEIIIDQLIIDLEKRLLLEQIESALQEKNEKKFIQATSRLKELATI